MNSKYATVVLLLIALVMVIGVIGAVAGSVVK